MSKTQISTELAPAAIGPYSQAIRCGDFLYLSGQIPLNPATMELVEFEIQTQTHRVFKNLDAVLTEAGATFDDVVKVEVFLDSMDDFKAVNEVYAEYFKADPKPARQAVEVAKLPMGVMVEISCIAYLGK